MTRTVTLTKDGATMRCTPVQAATIYGPKGWEPEQDTAEPAQNTEESPAPKKPTSRRKKD